MYNTRDRRPLRGQKEEEEEKRVVECYCNCRQVLSSEGRANKTSYTGGVSRTQKGHRRQGS